jgi:hypothetical protein
LKNNPHSTFLRKRVGLVTLFMFALYPVVGYLTQASPLLEFLRILQTATGFAVAIAYLRYSWRALLGLEVDREEQLALGIFLGGLYFGLTGLWAVVWRRGGRPDFMFNNDVFGFLLWLSVISGNLMIALPNSLSGRIPGRNSVAMGAAFGIAILVSMIVLWLSVDLTWVAEWIKPYVQEEF